MSININGYVMQETDFIKIREKVREFREVVLYLANKKMDKFHDFVFTQLEFTTEREKKTSIDRDSYPHALWAHRRHEMQRSRYNDYAVDTSFSVTFFPLPDRTLFICFAGEQEWTNKFVDFVEGKDFSYWDSSDYPENIPAKEWRFREKTWSKILGDTYIPGMSGFSINLISDYEPHPSGESITLYRERVGRLEALLRKNAEASNLPQET